MKKTLYTAHAQAAGGRNGHTATDDRQLDFTLAAPGGNKPGTNPEQLFACAYAACFGGAVEVVAKKQQQQISNITVHADISLHQDDTGYSLSATLNVALPGLDKALAKKIVQEAHQVCPYSKATRGNMPVTLKVNDEEIA